MRARKLLVLLAASSLDIVGCADRSAAQPEPAAPIPQVVSVGVAPPVPATGSSRVLAGDDSEPDSSAWRPGDPVPPLWLRPGLATARAPDRFVVVMDTTKGEVVVRVERAWAPRGVDRFYNLVRMGFYTDIAFFRAVAGFMIQFGIHGVPEVNAAWRDAKLADDPVVETNRRGTVTFAMSGPNTRTVQLFINTTDNSRLDSMSFTPFGEVIQGMDVVDSLYTGYGEGPPYGKGPSQAELQTRGNEYARAGFPRLDYLRSIRITY